MAGRDQTGPLGKGPMTGRGLGSCDGNTNIYGSGLGRGAGMGLRRGRGCGAGMGRGGRGQGFYQTDTRTQKEILTEEKQILEERLNLVSNSLENL